MTSNDQGTVEPMTFEQATQAMGQMRERLNGKLLGQPNIVDQVLIALVSGGHILIEGVPGLGKTLMVRVLAECIQGQFKRIQFTPDLMPADITGHVLFDMKESRFRLRTGPVFTNLLLADEINRAPAKTQAALLEVMQERQVTLEGKAHAMPSPFMVLATQNPIEQEGTYPLPEAQLDRFLLNVIIDYPDHAHEVELAKRITTGHVDDQTAFTQDQALISPSQVLSLQQLASSISVDDQVIDYAVRLVRASRDSVMIRRGAGPRASLALIRVARAHALLRGAEFVLPDDVKAMVLPVMRHRIQVSADMEIEGLSADQVLEHVIEAVEAPRT